MNTIKAAAAAFTLAVFHLVAVHAQTKPDIDLLAGTVNGEAMITLMPDQVTDLFGRPTAITAPRTTVTGKTEIPSTMVYGDLGLIFSFRHPRSDPQQTISTIEVFLSQQLDEDTHTIMKPFTGTLTRGVDGNWKAKRVMDEFAQFDPVDQYDAKKAQDIRTLIEQGKALVEELKAKDVESKNHFLKIVISLMTRIEITTPKTQINFNYEEQTKFLNSVEVRP